MQTKKHIQSQFISKIMDMMDKYSQLISWNDNGTELCLKDTDKLCQKILPEYFRHSNFNSFIRQLNIYNFHKTKRVGKSIWFKNEIFKKGNQNNFFLIQRKKKFNQLQNFEQRFQRECQDLVTQINNRKNLSPQMRQTLVNLFQYKFSTYESLKRMKYQIEGITKQLKDSRNKKVQQICKDLKQNLNVSIAKLISQSKKIQQEITKNILKQNEQTKQSLQPIKSDGKSDGKSDVKSEAVENAPQIYNINYQNMFALPQNYLISLSNSMSNYMSNSRQDSLLRSPSIGLRDHHRQFNSIPILLEQYKTNKQYAFEHKLYNPFNSQTSFVFMPSYIGAPSHIPIDCRFNPLYQSKIQQNPQKNNQFQDYEQSASISFARDLHHQQQEAFCQNQI